MQSSTVIYNWLSFKVLEVVDDKLEKADVTFVKFSDDDETEEEFGLTPEQMPKLIFFDNQIPVKSKSNMKYSAGKTRIKWLGL